MLSSTPSLPPARSRASSRRRRAMSLPSRNSGSRFAGGGFGCRHGPATARTASFIFAIANFRSWPVEMGRLRSSTGRARGRLARDELQANPGGARRMQGDRPGLVSYDSVRRNAAPGLERLHGGLGVRTEIAVDALRGDVPRAGSAIGQQSLQRANDLAGGALP